MIDKIKYSQHILQPEKIQQSNKILHPSSCLRTNILSLTLLELSFISSYAVLLSMARFARPDSCS